MYVGGTLALWTCCNLSQRALPFRPRLCVALAPVGDLNQGYNLKLSDEGDAVPNYMGGPPTASDTCPYR